MKQRLEIGVKYEIKEKIEWSILKQNWQINDTLIRTTNFTNGCTGI